MPACSLRLHALLAGLLGGLTLSKQALHKRLTGRAVACLHACICGLLSRPSHKRPNPSYCACFGRILLHDSSCVTLQPSHASSFPGPSNQSSCTQACLRLQIVYDLLEENLVDCRLTPFTRNDQTAAHDIVPVLKADDLVVRDLGYFSVDSLACIHQARAFFLTRWRFPVLLYDVCTGAVINLANVLLHDRPLDLSVRLSDGTTVRLLALPVPDALANQRRRKARLNRDRRLSHDPLYYHLLGWTLLLTNAPASRLPVQAACEVYRLRWRIEIIFKAWKSHLGLLHASNAGLSHLLPLVLGLLIFCILLHSHLPTQATDSPGFSLLKLTQFFALFLLPFALAHLCPAPLSDNLLLQLLRHTRYDRRSRVNYLQLKHFSLS